MAGHDPDDFVIPVLGAEDGEAVGLGEGAKASDGQVDALGGEFVGLGAEFDDLGNLRRGGGVLRVGLEAGEAVGEVGEVGGLDGVAEFARETLDAIGVVQEMRVKWDVVAVGLDG